MNTEKLALLGAYFVQSTDKQEWPGDIQKLIAEARAELDKESDLNAAQFNLWKEGGEVNIIPDARELL